jgi:hypothetical protein
MRRSIDDDLTISKAVRNVEFGVAAALFKLSAVSRLKRTV